MLSRLARLGLFLTVALLVWRLFLKPHTRQRLHGQVKLLAFALLASSLLMLAWHIWRTGLQ